MGGQQPFRVDPNGPPGAYQTYQVRSPADVTVVTACEQAGCLAWAHGWASLIDEATDLGRVQAAYIRRASGRTFTERPAGGLTEFRFESRQRCFAEHRTRPESYVVWPGDWRARLGEGRRLTAAGWVEDFGGHQQRVADQTKRG